jgi:hypothetical protein
MKLQLQEEFLKNVVVIPLEKNVYMVELPFNVAVFKVLLILLFTLMTASVV